MLANHVIFWASIFLWEWWRRGWSDVMRWTWARWGLLCRRDRKQRWERWPWQAAPERWGVEKRGWVEPGCRWLVRWMPFGAWQRWEGNGIRRWWRWPEREREKKRKKTGDEKWLCFWKGWKVEGIVHLCCELYKHGWSHEIEYGSQPNERWVLDLVWLHNQICLKSS